MGGTGSGRKRDERPRVLERNRMICCLYRAGFTAAAIARLTALCEGTISNIVADAARWGSAPPDSPNA